MISFNSNSLFFLSFSLAPMHTHTLTHTHTHTHTHTGRTFPLHPYFGESYKKGQEELYNVLRAYSVADEEVGYCQGMSYIAGIFLIHVRVCVLRCVMYTSYMYVFVCLGVSCTRHICTCLCA